MERIVKGIWIPIEIWEAQDLSWNEKILLMEIDSFTSQGKDCYISDERIADILKVSERSARSMVANLIKLGYIERTRFDGRKRYLQSTIAYQSGKICRPELQNLPNTYIQSTYISTTEINNNKGRQFDFKKSLIEIGVSQEVADDWMRVRKNKRASNTETAFKRIKNEIDKSGLSANECITIAVARSWQGFQADWLPNQQRSRPTGRMSVLDNNRMVAEELMRMANMEETS